jgi:hypothetical protein
MASDVMTRLMDENANMVIPKVGGNEAGIRKLILALQGQGYRVDLVGMNVTYDNAFRRMVGRFLKTGRLINPAYVEDVGVKPSATYRTLREQGVADGYAEIDGNGAIGEIPRLLDDGGALDGIPGYGRGGDGNLSPQAARAAGTVEDAPAAGVAFSAARPDPLTQPGPWRDAPVRVEIEGVGSETMTAGEAVDYLLKRKNAIRQLLDCVNAA